MNWLILIPILLPIAVGIFVIIAEEPIWKKLTVLAIFILLSMVRFIISDYTVVVVIAFIQMILFFVLLIYYRNRSVI